MKALTVINRVVPLILLAMTASAQACETAWCPPERAAIAPQSVTGAAPAGTGLTTYRRRGVSYALPARPRKAKIERAQSIVTPRAYADALARYRYLTGPRLLTAAGEPLRSPTVTRAELRGYTMLPIAAVDVREPEDFNEIDAAAVDIVEVDELNEIDRLASAQ